MADETFPIAGTNQITDIVGWESYFTSAQLDGIYYGINPSLNSGARTVGFTEGAALVRGFYKPVFAPRSTAVPTASAQNRIDRLVMRLDRSQASDAAAFIVPAVLQGTPGASTPPALTKVISPTGIWDLSVCRWTSNSNGSLSGLVDERYWLGGGFTSAARTGSLLAAWPPRVGVEIETNRVFQSNGATWTQVTDDDTGWVSLPIDWTTQWTSAGGITARKVGATVAVRIEVTRAGSSLGVADPDGSQIATLPTAMRAANFNYFSAQFAGAGSAGGITARLQVKPDGTIWCGAVDKDVPVGRHLRQTFTFIP
ncbi:hypothetical protein ACGFNU_21255 [Spirillospora sp. NPDC048911]|uniref:hypothetical protein n=1 Tax=Spirillospora sp. NPDC048911 TaxID=3364527 RepID=UPI003718DA99